MLVRLALLAAAALLVSIQAHDPVAVAQKPGPAPTAPVSGDKVCEGAETCSSCDADCGTCSTADDFASCPETLPECTGDVTSCCYRSFSAGSIVIPMDRCHQPIAGSGIFSPPTVGNAFCADSPGAADDGMFEAYGLVYRLMQNDIPVYWTVNPTKDPPALRGDEAIGSQTYNDRDIDFWVLNTGAKAAELGGALTDCDTGAGCVPPVLRLDPTDLSAVADSYTKNEFPTRGAAFVIDVADRDEFEALFLTKVSAAGNDYSGFAGNTLYDFSAVDLYEIQKGSRVVYLDYGSTGPPYD